MADYGVLPEGFVPQTTPVIREEIEEGLRQRFGRGFPLGDFTFAGHFAGIMSERLGLLWEVAEATYSAIDPDKAVGSSLRALGLLTGTFELDPSSSSALETLTGDDASVITAGSVVSTASFGKRFATVEDVTLAQLDDWAPSTLYHVKDRVTHSSRGYQCITEGTSAGSGGPTTNAADITDGTAHWTYLGDGEAAADVYAASEDEGPIVAVARDLTVIENPTGGWSSAINLDDAVFGRDIETDEHFRLRREAELSQPGTGPADAVRAAVLAITGVSSCRVFFNNTDATVDDLTPHSCKVLVQGGDDQTIGQVLWDNVPLGIATIGTTTVTVTDEAGIDQLVSFSRPVEKLTYVTITLTKNPKTYLGDDTVKQAVADAGNGRGTGYDVVASALSAAAFLDGVYDISSVLISVTPTTVPVSSATISIENDELAVYSTSRVTVNSSDGTP